jgi:hypothetical protein
MGDAAPADRQSTYSAKEQNMTEYKPGTRWQSSVCTGEFVVVKSPSTSALLMCGDQPVEPHGSVRNAEEWPSAGGNGTLGGKRYLELESGLEMLCTKSSGNDLSFDGRVLTRREAKALPASD